MVKVISEIGINHNGSMDLCKQLILLSKVAGCDYVKIQKRNPDVCVPEAQKNLLRKTPWGEMTDLDSVKLMAKYTKIGKIPSALITNLELCKSARENFETLIISTGMSNEKEIEECINACNPDVIMHTNSTYPCPVEELNLNYIHFLKEKWIGKEIGYSGHEYGLVTTYAAVAMGSTWIERHITLDRTMWGSDQSSSIEPDGLIKLVKGIRGIEQACKYEKGERREFEGELSKKKSLRG